MEKNPIEVWDQLVRNTLYSETFQRASLDKVTMSSYLIDSKKAKEDFRTSLLQIFHSEIAPELELVVRHYQVFFTNLLDDLFAYQKKNDVEIKLSLFIKDLSADLEEAFTLLETHFHAFFNLDEKVPPQLLVKYEASFNSFLLSLESQLDNVGQTQGYFESFRTTIANTLYPTPESKTSYRQFAYCKYLLTELSKTNFRTNSIATHSPFAEALVSLNFNDADFLTRISRGFGEAINVGETEQEKIKQLKQIKKYISQIIERNIISFDFTRPSAKQLIQDWLDAEIIFFESDLQVGIEKQTVSTTKLNTSVSVPILALLTRLLKESGVLTNSNQSEILKFVSAHFTSQKKTEISFGHLHSKFYQIDEMTKKKVSDLLIQMGQICKKLN